jgi:hypothetical protein
MRSPEVSSSQIRKLLLCGSVKAGSASLPFIRSTVVAKSMEAIVLYRERVSMMDIAPASEAPVHH